MAAAILALETGDVLYGTKVGRSHRVCGELVFNTAQTGYQEILTDPSYAGQILLFTQPHIGNTGVNSQDYESDRVYAKGMVVRHFEKVPSNWRSEHGLEEFLLQHGVVGISGIDTRRLTNLLRRGGALRACIDTGAKPDAAAAVAAAREHSTLHGKDLTGEVGYDDFGTSLAAPQTSNPMRVNAIDFGVKRNILRLLVQSGCAVRVFPAAATVAELLSDQPDGIFLANGPGDPAACDDAIKKVRQLLQEDLPLFGICLGCQLLALASGASTVKMKFGHHGANHPVRCIDSGQVLITSQNHGFAIDEKSLPLGWSVSHRSLFDGSLQGIVCDDKPFFGFQGHPEASPGPHDARHLFARFTAAMSR
ncbi:MAG: glutamine-hydrolyzing carbamoyl-phosphate synthase small subunit [Candidatus Porifericomitaceae bacterium WSBS_2022_MAG_OTU9]